MNGNNSSAQFHNSIWCFGDSAAINFSNPQLPIVFKSNVKSKGASVSIADENDSLLIYGYSEDTLLAQIFSKDHNLIANSNNILSGTGGLNRDLLLLPYPGDTNKFYLFTNNHGTNPQAGFRYSIIDLSFNSGNGMVTQKNILLQSFKLTDHLTAIKHGNGRDWWLFIGPYIPTQFSSNIFYSYLITPSGIGPLIIQNIGQNHVWGDRAMRFNKQGNRICVVSYTSSTIDLFDFDRCTGTISNYQAISHPFVQYGYGFFSAEFSPSGRYLYVAANKDSSYLLQYDLYSSNIVASVDTLFQSNYYSFAGWYRINQLQMAPDSNIYYANPYIDSSAFTFPYPDTLYSFNNMNLGVINEPDMAGSLCDFQPYSFSLNGFRTYGGIINNPDYELEKITNSPCDTIVSIPDSQNATIELNAFYDSNAKTVYLDVKGMAGNYKLNFISTSGKTIYNESGISNSPKFYKSIPMNNVSAGVIIVRLIFDDATAIKKIAVW